MRTKVTLALLFLNVALFFFIFKFEHAWEVDRKESQGRSSVLGPETANIQAIEIVGADPAASVSLVRQPDGWQLTRPFEWPANRVAVSRITNDLQQLQHETAFPVTELAKNRQSLADYGLDPPALTATFTSADPSLPRDRGAVTGRKYTVALGSKTPDGSSFYLLGPDREFVHVVGRSIAESLSQTPADLRLATLFTIADFEARSLAIQPPSPMTAIRLKREADDRWQFESPGTARADRTQTRLLINELGALRATEFFADAPAAAAAGAPTRISLDGNGRTETLLVYPSTSTEHFARMESKNTYFKMTLPAPLKTRLDRAQIALRDPHVLDFDARNVTRITITSRNGELELQRLDPATPNDSVSWRLSSNGANQSINADAAVVGRLLDQLTRLTAERFASDAPTDRERESWGFNIPERSVTLAVAPQPGIGSGTQPTSVRLYIGVDASRTAAFARVGLSESIYEVKPAILDEIPVSAAAYRDRLLRALPASAQITAIKLTDLLENRELPATPALAAQLRTIRARGFATEAFSEAENTVEKRPWRYRLDITTSPAGAGATPETISIFLGERGGITQYAGSRTFNLVWLLEQPLIDALWQAINGPRDPGPTVPEAK